MDGGQSGLTSLLKQLRPKSTKRQSASAQQVALL